MSLRIKLIAQTNVSFTRFLKAPKMPFRRINGKGIGFPCSVVKVFYFRYVIVCSSLLIFLKFFWDAENTLFTKSA